MFISRLIKLLLVILTISGIKSLLYSHNCAKWQESTNESSEWPCKPINVSDVAISNQSKNVTKQEKSEVKNVGQARILFQNMTPLIGDRFCGFSDDGDDDDDDDDESIDNSTGIRVKRYIRHGRVWHKTHLTWTLRTPSSHTKKLPEGVIRQQLKAAMNLWQQDSTLVFEEVHKESTDVDIYVDFRVGDHGDGNKFDGRGGTLAHAYYPGGGIGGDMHFDDAENFASHDATKEYISSSLLVTAAHELGHSLGLSHSDVRDALMAPFYQTFPKDFNKLPDDDIRGIQALYGRPELPDTTQSQTLPPPRPTDPPIRPTSPSKSTPGPTRPTKPPIVPKPPPTLPCSVSPPRPGIPDTCNTDFDAVTVFRREMYFFKGTFYWRISRKGILYEREAPNEIHRRFPGIPREVDHIDAAYENKNDNIVFISGGNYYVLDTRLMLLDKGTLASLKVNATRLSAAMTWGYNGRVYLFSDSFYWRLGYDNRAEADYPRGIDVWRGLPRNYSAAVTYRATTYFFAGKIFWIFNATGMRVSEPPSPIASYWFSCPHGKPNARVRCVLSNESATNHGFQYLYLCLFTLAVINRILQQL